MWDSWVTSRSLDPEPPLHALPTDRLSRPEVSADRTREDAAALRAEVIAMRQICGGFLEAQAAFAKREKVLMDQLAALKAR